MSEHNLQEAIEEVINRYNQFHLPKVWGSGKSVAADGTKWDLYEQGTDPIAAVLYPKKQIVVSYHLTPSDFSGRGSI